MFMGRGDINKCFSGFSYMASVSRRFKWMVSDQFSRQKAECLAFIFIMLIVFTIISMLWNTSTSYNDGTFIDLSEARQRELIEEYKMKQEKEGTKSAEYWENKKDMNHIKQFIKGEDLAPVREKWDLFVPARTGQNVHGNKTNDVKPKALQNKSKPNKVIAGNQPSVDIHKDKHLEQYGKDNKHEKVIDHDKEDGEDVIEIFNPRLGVMERRKKIKNNPLQGGQANCIIYDLTGNDTTQKYECIELKVKPKTTVCLHDENKDIHVSRFLRMEGVWEPHIVKAFQNILYGDPELGVIDVGTHIGQYSLIAASMGHHVVSVEPYIENLKRLRAGAQKGGVHDKIVAVKNAVSDHRSMEYLHVEPENQGGIAIGGFDLPVNCRHEGQMDETLRNAVMCDDLVVHTVHMDDILEVVNFQKAIIKIDIEGHEHRAFVHVDHLLDEIQVPYIFMEWMKLRDYYGSEVTDSEDKDLVFDLVDMLTQRGYFAHSSVTDEKLRPDLWYSWTDDIIWKHRNGGLP